MVFNTSMTGYQEILTDPSYAGQGVVMTYPLIGNYGVNREDEESRRPWAEAFVVRSLSGRGNNFRREGDLDAYLKEHNITGMQGIDTRALTRILRSQGTMNGIITCAESFCMEETLAKVRAYRVKDTVEAVTVREKKVYEGPGKKVALIDYGTKENLVRCLLARGCAVTVFPPPPKRKRLYAAGMTAFCCPTAPVIPRTAWKSLKKSKNSMPPTFRFSPSAWGTSSWRWQREQKRKNSDTVTGEAIIPYGICRPAGFSSRRRTTAMW
jgi:carbamoyl-phosphate synthase small subunit